MRKRTFCTVINCMDGRVQEPVNVWMKAAFGIDYVDVVTEAGPNGILARGTEDLIYSIKERVGISVENHGSRLLALAAHHDCAGNPQTQEMHLRDLAKALRVIEEWDFKIRKIGLWVNENWEVEKLFDDLETDLDESSPLILENLE